MAKVIRKRCQYTRNHLNASLNSPTHERDDQERVTSGFGVLLHTGNHLLAFLLRKLRSFELSTLNVCDFLVEMREL